METFKEFLEIFKDNTLLIFSILITLYWIIGVIIEYIQELLSDYYDHKQELKEIEYKYKYGNKEEGEDNNEY